MIERQNEPAFEELAAFASVPDQQIDLYLAALYMAHAFHPNMKMERYERHIQRLVEDVTFRHADLLNAGADDNVETRLAALKHVIADQHGYIGDEERPDHIQNADMVRVVDRGKGNPTSLSIIYIQVAEEMGWKVCGLSLPGYFAVRLDMGGQRLIFDPFDRCAVLHAPDLRRIVKKARGQHAELSVDYYNATPKRDILIRLQNAVKIRQIETEDYEGALTSVELMRTVDPEEYRLLLDAGVLYARTNKGHKAIDVLEKYIKKAPDPRDRQEAAILLQEIRFDMDADK